MYKLLNLTDNTRQNLSYNFETTKKVQIEFYYSEINQGWYITVTYNEWTIENIRLCCSENLLNDWRRQLGWGLKVTSTDNFEPVSTTDFTTERIKLYILTEDEVSYVTNFEYRYNSDLLESVTSE